MQRFTDIVAWQRAYQLALDIYRATKPFPSDERFGLTAQLRRAAVSVAANIAEGSRRTGSADYARFLNMAEASLAEVECLLMFSRDLGFLAADASRELLDRLNDVAKPLYGLRQKVEQG